MQTDDRVVPRIGPAGTRARGVALAGFLVFAGLAVLVHLRLLASLDLAVTRATQPLANPLFDALAGASALAVSGELSIVYGSVAAVLLWRAGAGRWSIAPLAFLLLEPIEVVLKTFLHQPPVPSEFYRGIFYPLTTVVLHGTFPSGHALRGGFLGTFLTLALVRRGGKRAIVSSIGCAVVVGFCGFSRVYLGYHWLSDVVAGLILGSSLALLVAPTGWGERCW